MKKAQSKILRFCYILGRALVISLVAVAALCIYFQDYLVFSQLLVEPRDHPPRDPKTLPAGVESVYVEPDAGIRVELWRVSPKVSSDSSTRVALVFHGNGGRVDHFYPYLEWFADRGYVTYGLEYRGIGASNGWPSVEAIKKDSRVSMEYIVKRERVDASDVLPVGVSLGTGFATFVADSFDTKKLVLVTPYTSLRAVAATRGYLGYLSPFLWNNIDSKEMISKMQRTCVVALHGRLDQSIPFAHSEQLASAYNGKGKFVLIEDPRADHNQVFWSMQEKILPALRQCPA